MSKGLMFICLVYVIAAFFLGSMFAEADKVEVVRTVTKVETDTLVQYYPMPRIVWFNGDTIHVTDTILMVEVKEYADTNYRVRISGYRPTLDFIEVYNTNTVSTITEREKKKRWGLGVTAGYGLSKAGLSPGIMVGLTYNIW